MIEEIIFTKVLEEKEHRKKEELCIK